MSYRYLDHITWADTAFEVRSASLQDLFRDAATATLSVMIREPDALSVQETRLIDLSTKTPQTENAIAELLHEFLEKLLFHKDADQLLLRPHKIEINELEIDSQKLSEGPQGQQGWHLRAHLVGEKIDPEKQELLTDVKAVTHHQFEVKKIGSEWVATVVLDV